VRVAFLNVKSLNLQKELASFCQTEATKTIKMSQSHHIFDFTQAVADSFIKLHGPVRYHHLQHFFLVGSRNPLQFLDVGRDVTMNIH
jgi:hypothetical protein